MSETNEKKSYIIQLFLVKTFQFLESFQMRKKSKPRDMTPTYLFFSIEFRTLVKKNCNYFSNFATVLCGSRLHSAAMHALILVLAGGGLLQEPFSPWFLCVSFTFQVILSTHAYILPEEISKL